MDRDPGWKLTPLMFLPIVGARIHARRVKRSGGVDGIVILRHLFTSFVSAVVLFALPVAAAAVPDDHDGESAVSAWLLVVGVAGIIAVLVARTIASRSLDCTSKETLADSYRKRFFLGIATSESVALLGFVGAFVAPGSAVYLFAGAISLVGFRFVAPTRAHLEREDEELRARGCAISLYDALT